MKRLITILAIAGGLISALCGEPFNYLKNADFSDVPPSGIPTGWGTSHWGFWYQNFEGYQKGWRMAPEATRDGVASFLLDSEACGEYPLPFFSCINGAPKGKKTFSVYLKTDKPDSSVVIVLNIGGNAERTFTPTASWERYRFTIDNDANSGTIQFFARGRIFINSPQLEEGTEATPFRTRESAPVNGDIDFDGGGTRQFRLTQPDGTAMPHPTDITLTADDEGLRFHIVNAIPATRLAPKKSNGRDNDLWAGTDNIQLFFFPQGDGDALCQFIIAEDGNVQDLRSANTFWDGVWEAKTTFEPGKSWTADVFLPFATFNDGGKRPLLKDWKWLAGRENCIENELGVSTDTRWPFFVFGQQDRWSRLRNLPVDAANAAALRIGKPHPEFELPTPSIAFPLSNLAKIARTFTVARATCSANGPWTELEEVELTLKAGETAKVVMEAPEDFPGCRITVKEQGKIVAAKSANCSYARVLKETAYQPKELLIAVMCEPDPTAFKPEVLAQIKAMGYNAVIFLNPPAWGENGVKEALDRLGQAGLKGICNFLYHDANPSHYDYMAGVVKNLKSHPALAGWLVCDEPSDGWNGIEFTQKGYELLKAIDTEHPIWINYTCNFKINRPLKQDMLGFDHYPIPDYDIREFLPMVEAYTQYGDTAFVYFQQTGHAYFYGREPTAAEFKFMGAAALLKGAVALGTFAQLPLSAELRAKAPQILGAFVTEYPIWRGQQASIPSPLPDVVEAEGRIVDGKLYAIYLNTAKEPVRFTAADGQQLELAPLDYVIRPIDNLQ